MIEDTNGNERETEEEGKKPESEARNEVIESTPSNNEEYSHKKAKTTLAQMEEGKIRVEVERVQRFRRRSCRFCQNTELIIHYRSPKLLEKFITDRGKILPRRITGTCAKHQRAITTAIKRARVLALLPFVVK